MKRKTLIVIPLLFVLVILAGCGSSKSTAQAYTISNSQLDSETDYQNKDNSFPSNENISTSSVEQPISYGSGKAEDYWEGDDFFDAEAFAKANGSVYTLWSMFSNGERVYCTDDISQATMVTFYFKGWEVEVLFNSLLVRNTESDIGYTTYTHAHENPDFYVDGTTNFDALKYVSLNKNTNVTLEEEAVPDLIKVIEIISSSAGQGDPFEGDKYDWIKKSYGN